MWLVLCALLGAPPQTLDNSALIFPKAFHRAGLAKVPRDARVDLILTADTLRVERSKKVQVEVPFQRIQRVQMLRGERHYPGATYAAAVATFGAGAFLILKKRQVDMAVIEFTNERGGELGLVFHIPKADGDRFLQWLRDHNVNVDDPPPVSAPAPAAAAPKPGSR